MKSLQERLEYSFQTEDLLEQALTHKSYFNENRTISKGQNERLEFLGDAVLDLILSELLVDMFQHWDEGQLSKVRASLVNEKTLSELSIELGVDRLMLLGRGEQGSGGAKKPRLLASAVEALIGAVFQDGGYDPAKKLVLRLFTPKLDGDIKKLDYTEDFKTRLQEKVQEKFRVTPVYTVVSEDGPDHEKVFSSQVMVKKDVMAVGKGKSKKMAEQDAARLALEKMK